VKYGFVDVEKVNYSIVRLCSVLDVSRSGYYVWRKRLPSEQMLRKQRLKRRIKAIYQTSYRSYGAPRVHAQLQEEQESIGRHIES